MKRKTPLRCPGVPPLTPGPLGAGLGFLLLLWGAALGRRDAAEILSVAFALVSLYVFASAAAGRLKDKEAVSYSLLWGTGALAMLTCLCALAALWQRLGG